MASNIFVDEKSLYEFIQSLNKFQSETKDLEYAFNQILNAAGETWQDPKYELFKDSFLENLANLAKFENDIDTIMMPFLKRALDAARDFNENRL